jgi:RHS repeat-associated protein
VTTFVYDGDGARVRQVKPDGSQVVYVGSLFEQEFPAASADLISWDGFESGNLGAWSSSATDGGNLSVSAAGALVGSYGLQALINDTNVLYARDDTPNAETRYRARFYFDPNSISLPSGGTHIIFAGFNSGNTQAFRVEFANNGGIYQVRAGARLDGLTTGFTYSSWYTISDAAHYIEIDWQASSAAGQNNGYLTLWLDGAQQQNVTGLDNDTRRVDYAELGAGNLPSGTSGTEYFDAFESRRTSYIGAAMVTRLYYSAGGQRIAVRVSNDATPANNGLFYLLTDHLGSTSITVCGNTGGCGAIAQGALVSELRYKPWGETRPSGNTGITPTSKHFTGQVEDVGIGLYFYGSRFYDSTIGRFISPDTIVPNGDKASVVPLTTSFSEPTFLAQLNSENAFTLQYGFWFQLSDEEKQQAKIPFGPQNPQALNRYAYVLNNPLRYTDPNGHCIWDLCIVEGIGVVEIVAALGAAYVAVYYSPNATENRAALESNMNALASTIETSAQQISDGINVVFLGRGRYAGDPRTAGRIIADEKQGKILGEFPSEWLGKTYDAIKKAADAGDKAAQTAKKLLDRKEYDKNKKK